MFRCGDRICGEVVRFSLAGCGGLDGVWVRAGCSSTRVGWVALSRSTLWSGLTRKTFLKSLQYFGASRPKRFSFCHI